MCYCNLLKLDDGHKGYTCMDKDCSSSYQRDRLLKGHLDEMMRESCKRLTIFFVGKSVRHKGDLSLALGPNWILRLHLFIRNSQLGFQQLLNDWRLEFTEPNRKQPCLLGYEPLPKLLISAVSESAYEVRNVIILFELHPLLIRHH